MLLKLHMTALLLLDLDSRFKNVLQSSGFHSLVLRGWDMTADELWTLPDIAHYLPLNNMVSIYGTPAECQAPF